MHTEIDESALFHQSRSAWCVLLDQQTLQLCLRTKAGEFDRASAVYFSRYGEAPYPAQRMEPVLRDAQYDYYQVRLANLPVKRLGYYFVLHRQAAQGDSTSYRYTETGLYKLGSGGCRAEEPEELPAELSEEVRQQAFYYSYFNCGDIHRVPAWACGVLAYEIFLDRFARSREREQSSQELPLLPWGTSPESKQLIGGDLRGITDKLSHLAELGVGLLYLTPIFQAHSYHKYDTTDYKQVDPAFGSNEDFRLLVQKCHRLGIRVVLDAVFNHCGPDFAPFVDLLQNGTQSRYCDWFHLRASPPPLLEELAQQRRGAACATGTDGTENPAYETFAQEPAMPKLNTENPELREYLLDVAEYWLREYDIDGWRLDVANEVDHGFWREFRRRVRALKPEALIVGEIWNDARAWLGGDQLDCAMNYPFRQLSYDFFLRRSIDAAELRRGFNALYMRYSPQVNQVQWNMLDSHDTARLIHSCGGERQKARLLLALMLSYVGAPVLYYGTEVGLEGGRDPDCRRCMPWDKGDWKLDIYHTVQRLAALRWQHSVLRTGALRWLEHPSADLLAFERFGADGASRKVLLNRAEVPVKFSQLGGQRDLLAEGPFDGWVAAQSVVIL